MTRGSKKPHLVRIEPDEVETLIKNRLASRGIRQPIIGVQITAQYPFGEGTMVHNEVPGLTVILADETPAAAPPKDEVRRGRGEVAISLPQISAIGSSLPVIHLIAFFTFVIWLCLNSPPR